MRARLVKLAVTYHPGHSWLDNNFPHQAVLGADSSHHRSRNRVFYNLRPPLDGDSFSSSGANINSRQSLNLRLFSSFSRS